MTCDLMSWNNNDAVFVKNNVDEWRDIISVTRLGDFLGFGQLFKSFGNNKFAQIILRLFVKVSKYIIFQMKSFLGNFYRHLAIFFWLHWT